MYVHFDSKKSTTQERAATESAFIWIVVWFTLLIFQLTYGKTLVSGLGLQSIWSPVLYTNALAIAPTTLIGAISGDFNALAHTIWTVQGVAMLAYVTHCGTIIAET